MKTTTAIQLRPLLLTLFLLAAPRLAAAPTYTVTDLGGLYPRAINNLGQVVSSDGLWENGKVTHLGRLSRTTAAAAINNRAQVVGSSGSGSVSAMTQGNVHAFLWQNGRIRDLGSPRAPSQYYATGINDRGQVIGTSYGHPVLWENGRRTYLPKLIKDPPYAQLPCETGGINSQGQCVGYADATTGSTHAVLWRNGRIVDLGTAGGHTCRAVAINDQGQIVGYGTTHGYAASHAFLWQNGRRYDLRTLPGDTDSEAAAINGVGQIVGTSKKIIYLPSLYAFPSRAFLWQAGKMQSLNALLPPHSGWHLASANGINDKGQIIGSGTYNGKPHGYLLTLRQ